MKMTESNMFGGAISSNTRQPTVIFLEKLKDNSLRYKSTIIDYSYTPRTLRACCSQSEFRIFKIRESSARALFS